jgi:hypothetical protein
MFENRGHNKDDETSQKKSVDVNVSFEEYSSLRGEFSSMLIAENSKRFQI